MSDTVYVDTVTLLTADTMNDLNRLHYTIFSDPADLAAVRTTIYASGQIKFPATQLPSADVNTLDDYVEGSFVPTATMSTSGTVTITSSYISYSKIGRRVFISGRIYVNSVSSPLGFMTVAGFPYAAVAGATGYNGISCYGYAMGSGASGLGGSYSGSDLTIGKIDATGGVAFASGDLIANTQIFISGSYETAN